jgi:predicted CXXCH cytochrome family protein
VGRWVAPAEKEECFGCHSTALVRDGERIYPRESLLGIGCESCHGPGKEHIQAVQRGERDRRMAHLAASPGAVATSVCGSCHRAPGQADLGDPAVRAQIARFQSTALEQSACFLRSGGRLGCTGCHDPHADVERGSPAKYNAVCRSCHSAKPAQRACPVQPTGDCISCHMPRQQLPIPTHPEYRNHWIGIWNAAKRL